jgi:membrane protein implicated in regulation of membrane protease activity
MAVAVRQVRVLRNVIIGAGLCALVLWLLRARVGQHHDALALGLPLGMVVGLLFWRHLNRNIARRDRRYERNKIFVNYLNFAEVLLAAVFYNPYLLIPISSVMLIAVLLGTLSVHWWTILASSVGLGATGVVAGCVVGYERRHGRLYYQYNSENWLGAEGLLYRSGTVRQALTPAGKVIIQGVLWNAVSVSRETIEVGEAVEVLSVERLTLYVDRLSQSESAMPTS